MAFDFPDAPIIDQVFTPPGSSRSYTWDGVAWMTGSSAATGAPGTYVLKAGDTMTGALTLPGDPTVLLHAATKQYVDSKGTLPLGGNAGEALVKDPTNIAAWGATLDAGNY